MAGLIFGILRYLQKRIYLRSLRSGRRKGVGDWWEGEGGRVGRAGPFGAFLPFPFPHLLSFLCRTNFAHFGLELGRGF